MGCTDFVKDQHGTQNKNLIFIELKAKSRGFTKQRRNNGNDPAMVALYSIINTGNTIVSFSKGCKTHCGPSRGFAGICNQGRKGAGRRGVLRAQAPEPQPCPKGSSSNDRKG